MKFIFIFTLCFVKITASTHWIVTESGLIQRKTEQPFVMHHPYDLLEFLNQDTRWSYIMNTYQDLYDGQIAINEIWRGLDKDTDMKKAYELDNNCVKAGLLAPIDWYTYILEHRKLKEIPEKEYQIPIQYKKMDTNVPDCKKLSSLTFSMFAFEHLENGVLKYGIAYCDSSCFIVKRGHMREKCCSNM